MSSARENIPSNAPTRHFFKTSLNMWARELAEKKTWLRILPPCFDALNISFEEEDRGKRIYFAGHWVNSKEEAGQWSDLESAIVP